MNPNPSGERGGTSRAMWFALACIIAVGIGGALWASNMFGTGAANATLEARRARIAGLTAAEKEQLQIKQERFAKLDERDREQLRALHAAIESHPRCDELQRVTMRYRQWLRELTPEDRALLLTSDVSERLIVVQSLQEKLHQRYLAEAGKEMSKEDAESVRRWMDEFAASRVAAALEASDGWEKRGLERAIERKDENIQRQFVWQMILRGKVPPPGEEDHRQLAASLSQEERPRFERAKTNDERGRVVNAWIMGAISFRRGWGGPNPSHEDLEKELAKLPAEERQRVSTLPPEQMRNELRRKWFASRYERHRSGGRSERGSGGRGPGDRGPGDRPPGPPGRGDRDDDQRNGEERKADDEKNRDRDGRRGGDRRGEERRDDDRNAKRDDEPADDEPADQPGDQSAERPADGEAPDGEAASVRRALIRTYGAT